MFGFSQTQKLIPSASGWSMGGHVTQVWPIKRESKALLGKGAFLKKGRVQEERAVPTT